jgi:hypothetical protein
MRFFQPLISEPAVRGSLTNAASDRTATHLGVGREKSGELHLGTCRPCLLRYAS